MPRRAAGSYRRPQVDPVSNDINSLTVADTRCLGRFWWPVWWPAFFDDDCKAARVSASGSHDGLMRPPVGLRNRWLSKEGLKGAVVIVVVFVVVGVVRLRTHNQNRTVAARAIADMKTFGHLS